MDDPTAAREGLVELPGAAAGPQYIAGSFRSRCRTRRWANVLFTMLLFSAVSCLAQDAAASVEIQATPTRVSFGNVAVGSSSETVTLRNSGTRQVTVWPATVTGAGFSVSGLSLPLTLTAGTSTTFTVSFAPAVAGSASGSVSVLSTATNSPATVSLSGVGAAAQTFLLRATPASLSFRNVTVGSTSNQTVTLTNTGTGSVTVSQATVTGFGFSISGFSLPLTLTAGQTTTFTATFAPTVAGSASGSVSVLSTATNSPATVSLSGVGVAAQTFLLSATPSNLSFGNVTVGSTSNQTVTLTNTGTGSVTVSQATVTGPGFSIRGLSLPLTLTAGRNTNFIATFAPTAAGSATGGISIGSSAANPHASVSLFGTGVNSPSPSVALSWTASTSQNLAGYNAYRGTVSGGPYTKLNSSLVATAFYTDTTVQFGQTYYYVTTAVDSNQVESAYSNQAQATLGTPQLTASPTSSNFGNIVLGSSSTLPMILTNTGTASVTISQANVTETGFSISDLCLPLALAAGQNTSFSTTFAPTAAGSVTGTVAIVSNATNSPTSESLSGTGIHAVNLSWTASTSSVTGYNVYRGTARSGPYTKLTSSPVSGIVYTDTAVQAGITYYYVTTAVNSSGAESAYSNQATATVPSP
jgi:hypothetical protein